MTNFQTEMSFSKYASLYDQIMPKNRMLRRISEKIDFTMIEGELISKYCLDNGRNAIPPLRLIKYLILKETYTLSDVDVVERSMYDVIHQILPGASPVG